MHKSLLSIILVMLNVKAVEIELKNILDIKSTNPCPLVEDSNEINQLIYSSLRILPRASNIEIPTNDLFEKAKLARVQFEVEVYQHQIPHLL